jgi:cytochrome c-type biogenesis protein CcmH/NrfG
MTRTVIVCLLFGFGINAFSQAQPARSSKAVNRPASSVGPTALLESARQSSARGDYLQAITKLRSALEMAPNSTDLLYHYGLVGLRLGKPAETVRSMAAATRLEPDNPDYL